jgi:ribosome biogenesis protein ENP2
VQLGEDLLREQIWDVQSGSTYTSIEPGHVTNDICMWPSSGLLFTATDSAHISVHFIPSLGPAPAWCSFLESAVEGLDASTDEAGGTVYDDFRFVTRVQLEELKLDHLLGTALVRAHMHGFFIDNRLYKKARQSIEPYSYEAYRQKRIAEKLEEERQSRIAMV